MEPAQAKPVRRRRLWPIILLFLGFVAIAAWSSRPLLNPRLVGKWEGWTQSSIPPSFAMFDLRADGTGTNTNKDWEDIDQTILTTGDPRPLCWWVCGDQLHLRLTSPTPSPLLRFWYSFIGRLNGGKLASFRVIQIDGRQLVLRSLRQQNQNDAGQDLKLKRPKP